MKTVYNMFGIIGAAMVIVGIATQNVTVGCVGAFIGLIVIAILRTDELTNPPNR